MSYSNKLILFFISDSSLFACGYSSPDEQYQPRAEQGRDGHEGDTQRYCCFHSGFIS